MLGRLVRTREKKGGRCAEDTAREAHLHEADVLGILAEALPADVQVVLANDTPLVRAHAAAREDGGRRRLGMMTFAGRGDARVKP